MQQLLRYFSESSNAKGVRSTALYSLQWGIGLMITGLPAIVLARAPEWLIIAYSLCLGLLIVTFISAFFFLLFKDRDALRSEHYSLSKLAIEHGLVGDSKTGLTDMSNANTNLRLSSNNGTN